jgi:hypothetical protein
MLHSICEQDDKYSESKDWVLHKDSSIMDDNSVVLIQLLPPSPV